MLEEQQKVNHLDTMLGASVVPVNLALRLQVKCYLLGEKSRSTKESRKTTSGEKFCR